MSNLKIVLCDGTELMLDAINFPADFIRTYTSAAALFSAWELMTDENLATMTVYEDDVETIKMTGYTLDSVQAVRNSDGTYTGHLYLRDGQYRSVVVDEVAEAEKKAILDQVSDYGGFHTEYVQSDKLGFDWREEYLGKVLLSRTYVEQENPCGTAENPIEYVDGVPLIDNAYYIKDGKRYVYMGGDWTEF